MFKLTFISFAIFALFFAPALGKVYSRCSLAREMFRLGVPKDQLARWTCIAKHESHFNSKSIGPRNSDGSQDYGIFQLNNKYWCSSPSRHSANQCKVKCTDLLIDSVAPSVTCARLVLKRQGWQAWSTWKYCSGKLPSINDCF